jgi:hypothetical protein
MKKCFAILLCAASIFTTTACSSVPVNTSSAIVSNSTNSTTTVSSSSLSSDTSSLKESSTQSETASGKANAILDNISMKVLDAKKEAVVGDRTADNVSKKNGEYFANGSDIVKATDYERIIISMQVENKSNKAITFNQMGWSATMSDGFKLKNITIDGDINGQVPSNYSGASKVSILAKKSLKVSSFKLTYNLMDYNDEWNAALGDLLKNGLSEEQFNKKYGDKFVSKPIDFNITLK